MVSAREVAGGTAIWFYVVAILLVTALAVGVVGALTQGWFISRQNLNIRNSIGYTTAANQRCHADIQAYLDAQRTNDTAHMGAAASDCRAAMSGVPQDAVDSDVAQFLATR